MKRALIVIDYQNDFVTGTLGFDKALELERGIVQKIEKFEKDGADVIFTFDTHFENYMETQEGKNLPIPHCIKNTEGWKLYGEIAKHCGINTKCFEKPTFGSMELAEYLKMNGYDSVELVGVVSNICVISNAVLAKAALPEAEIIVDASCTGSNDDSLNEKALDVMAGMHIKIINR